MERNTNLTGKPDTNVELRQPNSYHVISKGSVFEIIGGNLYDCESSDTSIATVAIGGGNARVRGNQAGTAAIAVGSTRGIVAVYNYQIRDTSLISRYTLKESGEMLFSEIGVSKTNPLTTTPATAFDIISWKSFDTSVATVASDGSITSVGNGATLILGRFTDTWGVERDVHIIVGVGELCKCDCDENGGETGGDGGSEIADKPDITDGKTLDSTKTGDSADWFEIARNGDYSLIMRTKFINVYDGHYNEPSWQYSDYGSTNVYADSKIRKAINAWWNRTAAGVADNLPENARVRQFTMQNDAVNILGTGSSASGGLENGFSRPFPVSIPSGSQDVAFALSFTEAANFVSKTYSVSGSGDFANSDPIAEKNFDKVVIPSGVYGAWLRSPGVSSPVVTAGIIENIGRAFQFKASSTDTSERGLVYPAMWVKTTIFDI